MRLKRMLALCLLLCMMLSLAACGDEGVPYVPPTVGTNNSGNNGNTDDPGNVDGPGKVEATWHSFDTTITTAKQVLTTEVGATITIDPVIYDEVYAGLPIMLDNSADQTLHVEVKMVAVNGVMLDNSASLAADAGDSDEVTLWLFKDQMRLNAIFNIETVELVLDIYNEDWDDLKQLEVTINANEAVVRLQACKDFYEVITNENAREELAIRLLDVTQAEQALGKDVYLKTKALVQYEYDSAATVYLELENRGEETRYLDLTMEKLNGLEHFWDWDCSHIRPNSTMLISFVVGGSFSKGMMMEAFGIEEIAQMVIGAEVYDCDDNYDVDYWADDVAHNIVTYTIPDTEVTLDMDAEVLYDNGQIRISSKEAVTNEHSESYIFLIFETVCDYDFYVEDHPDLDVEIEGESNYTYFDTPGWVNANSMAIAYLVVDHTEPVTVTLPMWVTNWETDEEFGLSFTFELD